MSKSKQFLFIIVSIILLTSCDESVTSAFKINNTSSGDVSFESFTDSELESLPGSEGESGAQVGGSEEESFSELLFSQGFESFDLSGNWDLADFGLDSNSEREDYVTDNQLKFELNWTKRTRNELASIYGREREEMTNEVANSLCRPQVEVGKERIYGNSNSDNQVVELDSDLGHCDISGNEPAALSIKSFAPSEVGYKYKLEVDYKMRMYDAQSANSYKDFVIRFGSELEKFEPIFDAFKTVEVGIVAVSKFSKIVLRDNGLPDGYGVLIDNVKVSKLGKADNYDDCADLFNINSKGFKKCLLGEVDTEQSCDFSDTSTTYYNYQPGQGVVESRKDTTNIMNVEDAIQGKINFLSLGLQGRLSLSCTVDGQKGLYDIFGKTLRLREISWGNATADTYPELARVRVRLEGCENESLNRVVSIGSVQTNEKFEYKFDEDIEGSSFEGCKMNKLIIRDITPEGPSVDGFDLNSVEFI